MSQQIPERLSGAAIDLSQLSQRGTPAGTQPAASGGTTPPDGRAVDVPSLVIDVTDATFEPIAQLSRVVPVVFDLWAEWCGPCKSLSPIIEKITREFAGKVVLAKVDVDANPQLARAFNAQSIPTVIALVAGQPVPLFQGALPEQQVREYFTQLLQLAANNGVSGTVNVTGEDAEVAAVEPVVNPAHAEALAALEQGDYTAAVAAYEHVLAKTPGDTEAKDALVQVRLLERLSKVDAVQARAAAAQRPDDIVAALVVADLDVSGGHVEDSFNRLLDLFAKQHEDQARTEIRERLLELFEVVGSGDPRVAAARGRLANLLY